MEAVDTSQRPLVRITLEPTPTLESFDQIFAEVELELARRESICVLADAEQTTRIDLAHVKRFAEFGETNHKMLEAYVRALAFVVPSAMVRGALKVAFQLKPPPHPFSVCKTRDEAEAYLQPFISILA
ncbi:STAS/SEC14 domain-containing protein [Pseudenhygromyxa sp. WMMC2535]|uniref:STAS/SEC14 domain-containing protein n=1 Tax=Pseudenhygromyxa sp. WMMC2535 TaxID=2712867 RepID=UPI001557074B|nr:STAS/SEC14 domain-containing protein [Pseudenhygromyxa sp. WMMC2535]